MLNDAHRTSPRIAPQGAATVHPGTGRLQRYVAAPTSMPLNWRSPAARRMLATLHRESTQYQWPHDDVASWGSKDIPRIPAQRATAATAASFAMVRPAAQLCPC